MFIVTSNFIEIYLMHFLLLKVFLGYDLWTLPVNNFFQFFNLYDIIQFDMIFINFITFKITYKYLKL